MSHERIADRLLELAYGELSPREAREVEAHAAGCAECTSELARLRATRRMMAALPEEPAPEAGERILLAAAREAARERAPARILPGWRWSSSVVAVLVLAVGAVSYRLLALRPAAERPGEELLGHAQYAEAPPASASERSAEATAATPAAAPPRPEPAPAPPRSAKATAPAKSRVRPLAERDEVARAAPAPDAAADAPAEARASSAATRMSPAEEPEGEGFAAPPEPSREETPRRAVAAPRSRSAAPASPAAAPAPERPPEAQAAGAGSRPDRSDAALERYASLRAAGSLSGEIRTFPGCEGESWRKVERDAQGRTVKYVREGRVAGRRLRIEHLFGADGALAAVRVSDLERGALVDAAALGLTLPRDATDAAADAPPRCER